MLVERKPSARSHKGQTREARAETRQIAETVTSSPSFEGLRLSEALSAYTAVLDASLVPHKDIERIRDELRQAYSTRPPIERFGLLKELGEIHVDAKLNGKPNLNEDLRHIETDVILEPDASHDT